MFSETPATVIKPELTFEYLSSNLCGSSALEVYLYKLRVGRNERVQAAVAKGATALPAALLCLLYVYTFLLSRMISGSLD